jgi:hypothetical protein
MGVNVCPLFLVFLLFTHSKGLHDETRRNGLLINISMRRKVSRDEKGNHSLSCSNARWRGFFGHRHPPLDADHLFLIRNMRRRFGHHHHPSMQTTPPSLKRETGRSFLLSRPLLCITPVTVNHLNYLTDQR